MAQGVRISRTLAVLQAIDLTDGSNTLTVNTEVRITIAEEVGTRSWWASGHAPLLPVQGVKESMDIVWFTLGLGTGEL